MGARLAGCAGHCYGLHALHLLLDAGATRYAIEATALLEIGEPDPSQLTLHQHHQLKDLSVLLGAGPEARPGKAVVFDTSPTLAVRVKSVRGVVDLSRAPRHPLPRRLLKPFERVVRGAIEHGAELFFELDLQAIASRGLDPEHLEYLSALPIATTDDRALAFVSQGRTFAVPLGMVSQVVQAGPNLSALPRATALQGVVLHQSHLWPAYSVPGLLGGHSLLEPLAVLVEVAGEGVGLLASAALGVRPGAQLQGAELIDLPRLFS